MCKGLLGLIESDRLRVGWLNGFWEGYRETRRCSRDTYAESYITKYTSIRRLKSNEEQTDRGANTLQHLVVNSTYVPWSDPSLVLRYYSHISVKQLFSD